jgi:hypothetical protein
VPGVRVTHENYDDWPTERWTFAGTRVNAKGKRVHAWLEPGGSAYLYAPKGSPVIGGVYTVQVKREDDSVRRTEPQYDGEINPDIDRAELQARDHAAKVRLAGIAAERKQGGYQALDEAIEPLVKVAAKLRTGAERDALIAYVTRRLNAAW